MGDGCVQEQDKSALHAKKTRVITAGSWCSNGKNIQRQNMVRLTLALALGALSLVVPGSGHSPDSLQGAPRASLGSMLRSKARTGASKGRPMGAISIMDFASLAMPGKTLSEKTLPLDRAKADEMCTGEGYVQASASGPVQTFSDPQHSKGLYYRTFGKGRRKVLMVMGLSASHKGWEYLIPLIVGQDEDTEVCVFDNRGINKYHPQP